MNRHGNYKERGEESEREREWVKERRKKGKKRDLRRKKGELNKLPLKLPTKNTKDNGRAKKRKIDLQKQTKKGIDSEGRLYTKLRILVIPSTKWKILRKL